MKSLAILVLSGVINIFTTYANAHPLYPANQFPAGSYYTEADIPALAGRPISSPCYLTGRFMCMGTRKGEFLFSNFKGEDKSLSFGNVLISLRFFGNAPDLKIGRIIVPTLSDPITITSVTARGGYYVVLAESWSQAQ